MHVFGATCNKKKKFRLFLHKYLQYFLATKSLQEVHAPINSLIGVCSVKYSFFWTLRDKVTEKDCMYSLLYNSMHLELGILLGLSLH